MAENLFANSQCPIAPVDKLDFDFYVNCDISPAPEPGTAFTCLPPLIVPRPSNDVGPNCPVFWADAKINSGYVDPDCDENKTKIKFCIAQKDVNPCIYTADLDIQVGIPAPPCPELKVGTSKIETGFTDCLQPIADLRIVKIEEPGDCAKGEPPKCEFELSFDLAVPFPRIPCPRINGAGFEVTNAFSGQDYDENNNPIDIACIVDPISAFYLKFNKNNFFTRELTYCLDDPTVHGWAPPHGTATPDAFSENCENCGEIDEETGEEIPCTGIARYAFIQMPQPGWELSGDGVKADTRVSRVNVPPDPLGADVDPVTDPLTGASLLGWNITHGDPADEVEIELSQEIVAYNGTPITFKSGDLGLGISRISTVLPVAGAATKSNRLEITTKHTAGDCTSPGLCEFDVELEVLIRTPRTPCPIINVNKFQVDSGLALESCFDEESENRFEITTKHTLPEDCNDTGRCEFDVDLSLAIPIPVVPCPVINTTFDFKSSFTGAPVDEGCTTGRDTHFYITTSHTDPTCNDAGQCQFDVDLEIFVPIPRTPCPVINKTSFDVAVGHAGFDCVVGKENAFEITTRHTEPTTCDDPGQCEFDVELTIAVPIPVVQCPTITTSLDIGSGFTGGEVDEQCKPVNRFTITTNHTAPTCTEAAQCSFDVDLSLFITTPRTPCPFIDVRDFGVYSGYVGEKTNCIGDKQDRFSITTEHTPPTDCRDPGTCQFIADLEITVPIPAPECPVINRNLFSVSAAYGGGITQSAQVEVLAVSGTETEAATLTVRDVSGLTEGMLLTPPGGFAELDPAVETAVISAETTDTTTLKVASIEDIKIGMQVSWQGLDPDTKIFVQDVQSVNDNNEPEPTVVLSEAVAIPENVQQLTFQNIAAGVRVTVLPESGSAATDTLVLSDVSNIKVGMAVSGPGIPTDRAVTVKSITPNTNVVTSAFTEISENTFTAPSDQLRLRDLSRFAGSDDYLVKPGMQITWTGMPISDPIYVTSVTPPVPTEPPYSILPRVYLSRTVVLPPVGTPVSFRNPESVTSSAGTIVLSEAVAPKPNDELGFQAVSPLTKIIAVSDATVTQNDNPNPATTKTVVNLWGSTQSDYLSLNSVAGLAVGMQVTWPGVTASPKLYVARIFPSDSGQSAPPRVLLSAVTSTPPDGTVATFKSVAFGLVKLAEAGAVGQFGENVVLNNSTGIEVGMVVSGANIPETSNIVVTDVGVTGTGYGTVTLSQAVRLWYNAELGFSAPVQNFSSGAILPLTALDSGDGNKLVLSNPVADISGLTVTAAAPSTGPTNCANGANRFEITTRHTPATCTEAPKCEFDLDLEIVISLPRPKCPVIDIDNFEVTSGYPDGGCVKANNFEIKSRHVDPIDCTDTGECEFGVTLELGIPIPRTPCPVIDRTRFISAVGFADTPCVAGKTPSFNITAVHTPGDGCTDPGECRFEVELELYTPIPRTPCPDISRGNFTQEVFYDNSCARPASRFEITREITKGGGCNTPDTCEYTVDLELYIPVPVPPCPEINSPRGMVVNVGYAGSQCVAGKGNRFDIIATTVQTPCGANKCVFDIETEITVPIPEPPCVDISRGDLKVNVGYSNCVSNTQSFEIKKTTTPATGCGTPQTCQYVFDLEINVPIPPPTCPTISAGVAAEVRYADAPNKVGSTGSTVTTSHTAPSCNNSGQCSFDIDTVIDIPIPRPPCPVINSTGTMRIGYSDVVSPRIRYDTSEGHATNVGTNSPPQCFFSNILSLDIGIPRPPCPSINISPTVNVLPLGSTPSAGISASANLRPGDFCDFNFDLFLNMPESCYPTMQALPGTLLSGPQYSNFLTPVVHRTGPCAFTISTFALVKAITQCPVFSSSVGYSNGAGKGGDNSYLPIAGATFSITPGGAAGGAECVYSLNGDINGTILYGGTGLVYAGSGGSAVGTTETKIVGNKIVTNINLTVGDCPPEGGGGGGCIEGPPGVAGPQGPPGPQGPRGFPGVQGPMGIQGPQGAQGPQGLQGANGAPGAVGPAGPQGIAGPKGDTGDDGEKGETGVTGATGPEGPTGPAGCPGVAGPQGAAGPEGPVGAQGPTGPKGDKGDAGNDGAQGPVGATGAQGPTGGIGATGLQGPAGAAGPQGDKGEIGPAGATGPQGATGATGVGATGPQGATGLAGVTGATGPAGAAGPAGAVGPQGPQGVTGAQGPAGPQGPEGPKGDTGVGEAGPQGEQGPAGPAGPQGVPGLKGDKGDRGATGQRGPQGVQGPQGLRGERGLQGVTGAQGPTGDIGVTGATGATGAQGPIGFHGATGPAGVEGPQGATGATGPAPRVIATADASVILVSDRSGRFVELHGITGATGPAPVVRETADVNVVEIRGGGDSVALLEAPHGPTGATGPCGITGSTGPTGPAPTVVAGPTNNTIYVGGVLVAAAQGATGIQGPPGPQGPTGPLPTADEIAASILFKLQSDAAYAAAVREALGLS